MLYVEPIVERSVPASRVNECIQRHRGGAKVPLVWPGQKESVFKTSCIYQGFEWWIVEFPSQRKMFAGPPEFFQLLIGERGRRE